MPWLPHPVCSASAPTPAMQPSSKQSRVYKTWADDRNARLPSFAGSGCFMCSEDGARSTCPRIGKCDEAPGHQGGRAESDSTHILGPVLHFGGAFAISGNISPSARASATVQAGKLQESVSGSSHSRCQVGASLRCPSGLFEGVSASPCQGRQVTGFTIEEQGGAADGPMLLKGIMRALLVLARVQGGLVLEIPTLTVPCIKGAAYHSN